MSVDKHTQPQQQPKIRQAEAHSLSLLFLLRCSDNAAPMTAMPARSGAAAGLPAGAPTPGQTAQQLGLKPHEKQRFDALFYSCEGSRSVPSAVSGGAIKSLFTASRLPKASLAQVWTLADRQKRKALDLEDFYIACRLIAIAQQNLPVTYQSLKNYTDIPLPNFEGGAMPQQAAATPAQMPLMQQPLQQQQAQPRKMVTPSHTHFVLCGCVIVFHSVCSLCDSCVFACVRLR